jgi:hypothetical protein
VSKSPRRSSPGPPRRGGGSVSLETILIIGAIAVPILLFLLKVAWPTIKTFFNTGVSDLETSADNVSSGN